MAKTKQKPELLKKWLTDKESVFKIICDQGSHILQHEISKKHRKLLEEKSSTQLQIKECERQSEKNEFTIEDIRHDIEDSDISICVDETTDVKGRYIANLIVSKLSDEGPSVPYLLTCRVLEKTNHAKVACFINDSLGKL
ncbi:unnamed protein product [Brassicogethes aeneus]|uniref:Uncharacterized protein n=1 Tax=Brassicogethes aeneus TaxID=1431903 RepID=A0A9P0ARG0_BRAAE|nr:unnamed protein product [Brassicogethes aeneus]